MMEPSEYQRLRAAGVEHFWKTMDRIVFMFRLTGILIVVLLAVTAVVWIWGESR